MKKYDDEYFQLQEDEDENYIIPFRKARAFGTLLLCFDIEKLDIAAAEIVYEASFAGDENELFEELDVF